MAHCSRVLDVSLTKKKIAFHFKMNKHILGKCMSNPMLTFDLNIFRKAKENKKEKHKISCVRRKYIAFFTFYLLFCLFVFFFFWSSNKSQLAMCWCIQSELWNCCSFSCFTRFSRLILILHFVYVLFWDVIQIYVGIKNTDMRQFYEYFFVPFLLFLAVIWIPMQLWIVFLTPITTKSSRQQQQKMR